MKKELKTKSLTIIMGESDYSLLSKIRQNHNKSVSQLIRDAILFYAVYYSEPIQPTTDL